jgi:hypothetical protein
MSSIVLSSDFLKTFCDTFFICFGHYLEPTTERIPPRILDENPIQKLANTVENLRVKLQSISLKDIF